LLLVRLDVAPNTIGFRFLVGEFQQGAADERATTLAGASAKALDPSENGSVDAAREFGMSTGHCSMTFSYQRGADKPSASCLRAGVALETDAHSTPGRR